MKLNPFKWLVTATAVMFLMPTALKAQTMSSDEINLIPQPSHIVLKEGRLQIGRGFRVSLTGYAEPRLNSAVARFVKGFPLLSDQPKTGRFVPLMIHCGHAAHPDQLLRQEESYALTIMPTSARLDAPTPLGVLHGMETFRQLVREDENGCSAPAVQIEDTPRFAWRGLMIDTVRHFMPVDVLKGTLDRMAAVKMNVFHWHLTDDQAVRAESRRFPKLHPGGPDDQYYTQTQMKEIVAYAADRGIRVVPEFEGPAHASAWTRAYPQLAASGQLDPTNEEVYRTLDAFIGEMATVFPEKYFHTGGDEVDFAAWAKDPHVLAYMAGHGITDAGRLQSLYTQRVHDILRRHGKIMIGWNEVLTPDLPADVTVQSWTSGTSLADALKSGHQVILSHGYYLDHPLTEDFYANDPETGQTPALSPEERARLLGGEACMWTEQVTPETIYARIWPRAAALAERLWSPRTVTDEADLNRRLGPLFSPTPDRHIMLFDAPQAGTGHGEPSSIPGTVQSPE